MISSVKLYSIPILSLAPKFRPSSISVFLLISFYVSATFSANLVQNRSRFILYVYIVLAFMYTA